MGLNELTITQVRDKINKGEISISDVVKDLKLAIDEDSKRDDSLNAYISFNMDEIQKEIDNYSNSDGNSIISGVPIAIKDIINVKQTKTTCASKILKDYRSPYDATAIEYLRKNGGIPVGKLNMDEFAMGSTNENSSFGIVRNPYNRKKIPGGSSGGAASAVAGNLAIAALGSDTGGSIRQPASMCGVFGIKPTYGRVSRYGLIAYASSFDQIGPITKTVMDGALLLEAVSGYDEKDSTSARVQNERYSEYVGQSIKGKNIGIPDEYFGDGLDKDVRRSIENSINILKEAGANIKKINLKYTKYAIATYYIIATAEASSNLARFDGIRYGTRFVNTDDLDTLYKQNRSIGFGNEVKRRILLGTFTLSSGYYDAYYLKAQKVRTLIREDFKLAFNEVDLIVTPVSPRAAWDLGQMVDDPLQMYLSDIYTVPINIAGLPAASVPCGKTSDGMPIGLQIIAYHFNEADIFRAARIVEEELNEL